ncbi:hypothetical protein [Streptomyces halobius]|uniref:Secreted protein n=1 Tax=Streptomyces halobius TaxID=2879846 RepID=A0ABY4MIU5_9ACTN|nr:hypothetical protein [Streptomyces halobius]UQA97018.1 hypothetical protein K9S39_38710 [Streptomyces halobius]
MRLRTTITAAALAATALFGSAGIANAQGTDGHGYTGDSATRAGERVSREGAAISQEDSASRAGESVSRDGDQVSFDTGRITGYDENTGRTVFVDLPTFIRHLPDRF